jgi:pimeloyl-ACP methyl ester carboxylesterase
MRLTRLIALLALLLAGACAVDFVLWSGRSLDAYGFDSFEGEMLDREALDVLGPLDPAAIRELRIASGTETLGAVLVAEADVSAADTLIVFFHGSSRHLDYYWARVRLLHATGYPVLAVDYRGYGVSTGSSDVPSVLEDARATMRFVEEELGGPTVVIYGNSLGTTAAARMAAENDVAALALEVPINSLETAVADQFGASVPPQTLFEQNVSVREDAAASGAPLLVFAADSDALFPPERHADRVFAHHQEQSGAPGTLIRVPGGHDDVPSDLGYDEFVRTVADFVGGP